MTHTRTNAFGQPIGLPVTTTLPRPAPPHSTMTGRLVSLQPMQPEHASGLFDAFGEDETGRGWTYLPRGPFADLAEARDWTATCAASKDPQFYTILGMDGRILGACSYLRIDPANGVIEVGNIHFSPRLQRRAEATETMYLMMARAFDDLGYRRYEWKCDALNAPSRKAAKRLGFTYEGTFRQAIVTKGRNRDTAWFSIIDREWPARKARFEAWLAPENFDAEGQQKTALNPAE